MGKWVFCVHPIVQIILVYYNCSYLSIASYFYISLLDDGSSLGVALFQSLGFSCE